MGFFSESELISTKPPTKEPQCGSCGLFKKCKTPKMKVSGEGRKKILLIGEAPGATEDQRGIQFCGKAGEPLERALRANGIEMRMDCWLHNAIICRPPENSKPTNDQIGYCRPNLINLAEELKPNLIILLGEVATHSMMGWIWKEDFGTFTKWTGWQIPSQQINSWVCPTHHPARFLHSNDPVVDMQFKEHIKNAVKLAGSKPWTKIPDYTQKIKRIYDPVKASIEIDLMTKESPLIAFDYETDRLKPDHDETKIVSCAISDGTNTIAYPWVSDAVKATGRLLSSEVPKIGANMNFEQRHTLKQFNHPVNNWWWDVVKAAHHIDNRAGITSVKFQAFVLLGVAPWDRKIRPLLKSKEEGGNAINRIKEIKLEDLLLYNGMDALHEFNIAIKQISLLGWNQ